MNDDFQTKHKLASEFIKKQHAHVEKFHLWILRIIIAFYIFAIIMTAALICFGAWALIHFCF